MVNIRKQTKVAYINAINNAELSADLLPLIDLITSEMLHSIAFLGDLPPPSPADAQWAYNSDFGGTQIRV